MSKKTARKTTPKSQSEKAAEKKAKALDKAGDALIAGDKKKAAKALKKAKAKKLDEKEARSIVGEARAIDMQIIGTEHEMEAAKENYRALKSRHASLIMKLREEIRDDPQSRLPFTEPKPRPAGEVDAAVAGANGEVKPANGQLSLPHPAEPADEQLEAELTGTKALDEIERSIAGDEGLPPPAERAARGGRRTRRAQHESAA